MSDLPDFGGRLRAARQEQGLTQERLAERVGCAVQTIRKLEGGRRRPSYQMAARIAEVLHLEPTARTAWMTAARARREPDTTAAPVAGGTLPTYLTPFVGRRQEQALLVALLVAAGGEQHRRGPELCRCQKVAGACRRRHDQVAVSATHRSELLSLSPD